MRTAALFARANYGRRAIARGSDRRRVAARGLFSVTAPNPHAVIRPQISLLSYAPAMVLLLIAVADSAQFPDTDLSGHLRFGQAAIASGHLAIAIRILTAPPVPSGAITNG